MTTEQEIEQLKAEINRLNRIIKAMTHQKKVVGRNQAELDGGYDGVTRPIAHIGF